MKKTTLYLIVTTFLTAFFVLGFAFGLICQATFGILEVKTIHKIETIETTKTSGFFEL